MVNEMRAEKGRVFGHLILWAVLLCLLLLALIAYFLEVDVVTRGIGKVIPSKHIQVIENLEGGIVKKIYVRAGQIVQKDQILVELDDVRYKSEYEEGAQKELALKIRVAVLNALVLNKNIAVTPEMQKGLPSSVAAETAYFVNKREELRSLRVRYQLLNKEINLTKPLVKEGVMSTVELLRLERDLEGIQGGISNWYSTILSDLNEANDKLDEVVQKNKATLDRWRRTTVRSPLYGVVKEVHVTTEGGVVKPDDPIIEIVPLADTLLIETLIAPRDIGFVHKGLPANVKITAYDYTLYGQLDGVVENVSADTFTNNKGESFYKIWVRTNRNYLIFNNIKHVIFPGMEASVDILTGKRTLMHYIMKPFLSAKERAFVER